MRRDGKKYRHELKENLKKEGAESEIRGMLTSLGFIDN